MNCPENKCHGNICTHLTEKQKLAVANVRELSEPTPDSFYINSKKLYTEAYVREIEKELKKCSKWSEKQADRITKLEEKLRVSSEINQSLAIAVEAMRQVCSSYAIPDYERSVLKEALIMIGGNLADKE